MIIRMDESSSTQRMLAMAAIPLAGATEHAPVVVANKAIPAY
jgi:hypothetical protein